MALIARQPENAGTRSEPVTAGMHTAVCYAVIDLGEQYSEKFNNTRRKVLICWETDEDMTMDDGTTKPKVISKEFALSLFEKSDLRKTLTSWRGRDFTPEELQGFDLEKILGAPCLLNVVEQTNGERTYHNVGSVSPLMRGMQAFELYNEKIYFELTEETVDGLDDKFPKWVADKIKKSTTYSKIVNGNKQPAKPTLTPIDDIEAEPPF